MVIAVPLESRTPHHAPCFYIHHTPYTCHALDTIGVTAEANRAIDSNIVQDFYSGSCTYTKFEKDPWWKLDFGNKVEQGWRSGMQDL